MLASFTAKELAMTKHVATSAPIDLRQRMIEDMEMHRFSREAQRNSHLAPLSTTPNLCSLEGQ